MSPISSVGAGMTRHLIKGYMLFASLEVCMVRNCDQGLENAAEGCKQRVAFSSLRS